MVPGAKQILGLAGDRGKRIALPLHDPILAVPKNVHSEDGNRVVERVGIQSIDWFSVDELVPLVVNVVPSLQKKRKALNADLKRIAQGVAQSVRHLGRGE